MKKKVLLTMLGLLLATSLVAACAAPAPAPQMEPIELDVVAFKYPSKDFMYLEAYCDEVEARSNGLLKFNRLGGAEVIPPLEQHDALSRGVFDVGWLPAPYGAGIVPEILAHALPRMNSREQRECGFYDIMNECYMRHNMYYLMRNDPSAWEQNFVIISKVPIEKPEDMKGLRMRSTARDVPLLEAFGAIPITMTAGDVYTALERGLVDALPFTVPSTFDYGLDEVIEYYILPGYGQQMQAMLFNLDTWESIPSELQKLMKDTELDMEAEWDAKFIEFYEAGLARLDEEGIKCCQFSPADGERLVGAFYDGLWRDLITKSPVDGPRFREVCGLPPLSE